MWSEFNVINRIEQSYIPFWLSRRGRIFPLPFFPSWDTLHWNFVNHPLNVVHCLPCTKCWNLWCQSPYPPRKRHNNGIEPGLSSFMECAPVLALRYLIIERSVIRNPPSWLEGNPPCHEGSSIFFSVDIRRRTFFLAFDPSRDLFRPWSSQ